jgi:hypothetical protein
MANPFQRGTEILGESWRILHDENTKFVKQRMSDNMKTFERIVASRTPPEFFAAQQKWFEETARAYGDHWTKCAQLVKDALGHAAPDLGHKARADEARHDARGLQRAAREALSR